MTAPSASAAVYWAAGGDDRIGRANLDGTGVNRGFIHTGSVAGVAVDSEHVYWAINGNPSTIARANLDGTGIDPDFITLSGRPNGVAVDATHIYWGQLGGTNDGRIGRANLDGSDAEPDLVTGVPDPCGVAVDGTHVYWGNTGGSTVGRAKRDGSEPDPDFIALGGDARSCGVAVNATHILWGNHAPGESTIGRANLNGSDIDSSFVEGVFRSSGLAVDATHLYWTNTQGPGGSLGSIGRAALDGSGVTQSFVTGIQAPGSVAVDALQGDTVTIEASKPVITYGEQVDFTAAVVTAGPAATGEIDFAVNGAVVESVPLDGSGRAAFTPPFALDVGDKVSAFYSGDDTYVSGGSGPAQLTITPAATTTAITSSPNPVTTGGTIDLNVRVENADTAITPFGSVDFRVNGVPIGPPFALDDDGTVRLEVEADVPPGQYVISARYRDDTAAIPDFIESNASITQTVAAAAQPAPPAPPPPAPPPPARAPAAPTPNSPLAAIKADLTAMNRRLVKRLKAQGVDSLTARQRLAASAPGTLSVKVSARDKGRTVVIAQGQQTRTSAGTFTLQLRLTRTGRRVAARSRELRLRIVSTFALAKGETTRATTRVAVRPRGRVRRSDASN